MKNGNSFERNVREARKREEACFRWITEKASYPGIRLFDWPVEESQGPALRLPPGKFEGANALILPDIGCWRDGRFEFVEVKSGKGFSWSGRERCWQVSVDLSQFAQYRRISEEVGIPVWIFFFLEFGRPTQADLSRGAPKVCPRGLYAVTVHEMVLRQQRSEGVHSFTQDLYVEEKVLHKMASYEDMVAYLPPDEPAPEPIPPSPRF